MTLRIRCLTVLAVVLVIELVVMAMSHGTPWRGEWNWTLDYAVGTTALTGPLLGAFAAWTAAGERSRAALNDGTARGWLVPAVAAGMAVVVGTIGFAIALGAGALATATVPHGGPFAGWFVVVVPLLFAAYAGLGAVVGHLVPQRVVVVLVAPGLFVLGMLAALDVGPNVLRQGLTSGSLAGITWNPSVVGFQAAVLVGIAALAVLIPALVASIRTWPFRLAAGAGLALVVAGVVGLEHGGDYSFETSAEQTTACAGTAPRVCLPPSNRRSLAPIGHRLHQVAAVLTEAGASVPETYTAGLPATRGRHGDGFFALPANANLTRYSLLEAAQAIATPEPCAAWFAKTAPPGPAFEARTLISTWVLRRLGEEVPAFTEDADHWLRETPAAEQKRWVVWLFEQLRGCKLGEIRTPWQK